MKLKTLQNKEILKELKNGKTYYADYSKIRYKDYIPQWKKLAQYCGFSHCPIFCTPEKETTAISASGLNTNDNDVMITLNVPDNECVIMDYYQFADYLYYSSGQEYDSYFKWGAKKALENIDKYIILGEYENTPQIVIDRIEPEWLVKSKNESLLLEKTRKELIDRSKNAEPTKSYGTTRYDRRGMQHVYNTVNSFDSIDMNRLFKDNNLLFNIPVKGESNNYNVKVLFNDVCNYINSELRVNNYKCEYKIIYRALIKMINNQNIYINCSCPDWKYRMAYYATKDKYNSGNAELIPAKVTNPKNNLGAGCKHVMNILSNLDWALTLATSINNYIEYMKEKYNEKYINIIFPAIYKMSYDKALQTNIISEDSEEEEIENEIEVEDNIENKEENEEEESN